MIWTTGYLKACCYEALLMSNRVVVDLFAEDLAHEKFLEPMLNRVAREEGVKVWTRVISAKGGHGRAIKEFERYQNTKDKLDREPGDFVVVAIDGNCSTFVKARGEILNSTTPALIDKLVVACPDPHVERWYLADPKSFEVVVGYRPRIIPNKCERDHYKHLLSEAIRKAGHPVPLGGIEFASELVEEMDLYRAGKSDSSLKAFLDDLRIRLKTVSTRS